MQTFLLWRRQHDNPVDPQAVAERLLRFYGPMFEETPRCRIFDDGVTQGVYLELPVKGWRPAYLNEDERGWALALDYPIDAAPALRAEGVRFEEGKELLALADRFQENPKGLLARLSPPYVLVWPDRHAKDSATWVQLDGLGLGQIFEYDDGATWAVTNRIFALKALGIRLQPEAGEWATRYALGWFPLELTGFRHLSALKPATRLKITREGVARERFEVLGDWLAAGQGLSQSDALELARVALIDYVKAANPLWSEASAGLTGGMDSRATVATLLGVGATDYFLRVRGRTDVNDVIVARHLCDLAKARIRVNANQSLPPARLEDLRRNMTCAIKWQAGHTDAHILKHFLQHGQTKLDGGNVNIMGHHGALGRGFYIERSKCLGQPVETHEDRMYRYLVRFMRSWIRPEMAECAQAMIRQAFRQADHYGLEGDDRVDFFYLYERTRRWGAGGQYHQCGKVIAPFIEPRNITASYAIPPAERLHSPFHHYIAETNVPAWAGVPDQKYLDKKTRREMMRSIEKNHPKTRWQKLVNSVKKRIEASGLLLGPVAQYRASGRHHYNNMKYWEVVGEPLIREALETGGLWTEIFDPDVTAEKWTDLCDDLVLMHLVDKICKEPLN